MSSAAYSEARALIRLAYLPGHSIEEIRKDISPGKCVDMGMAAYRFKVLEYFDEMTGRAPVHRANSYRMTDAQRKQIVSLIQAGLNNRQIIKRVRVASNYLVKKVRHELGQVEDRRFKFKLSDAQMEQARTMLRDGDAWKCVAAHFGLTESTLRQNLPYRKRDDRNALIRLEREKYHALVQELQSGKSIRRIERETHTSCYTLKRVRIAEGLRVYAGWPKGKTHGGTQAATA